MSGEFGQPLECEFLIGGLRVNADAHVLDGDGAPLPGLYAAGSCAAAIIQTAKGYASGMTLANGSFYGRVAAIHASENRQAARVAATADVAPALRGSA